MPPKNKSKKSQTKAVNQLARAVKSMRVQPKRQSKALSLGGLAGILPANVTYKGATEIGVALGKKMFVNGPTISTGRGRVYNVKNRELVMPNINGAGSFTLQQQIEINPGLSATFPWLSAIAANYSEYKFNKLVFRYITRSPTTKSGAVMIVPLYDPLSVAPLSEQAASAVRGALEGPVWEELAIQADQLMSNAYKRYFLRNGPIASDLKTYDPMALAIYTNDCVDNSPVGKLWVEYDVDFYEPTSTLDLGVPTQQPSGISMWAFVDGVSNQNLVVGPNNIDWRIGAPVCNSLKLTLAPGPPVAGGYFTPPPGCYIVRAFLSVKDNTAESISISFYTLKNGVLHTSGTQNALTVTAGQIFPLELMDCINCNGTDTIQTVAQMGFGGAGTVTVIRAAVSLEICSN